MADIDDLFRKPNLPSSYAGGKRKFEASDAQEAYKAAKLSPHSDAKGTTNGHATVEDDPEEDTEAGPELPPEDDGQADEEGRFFGGGVTRNTTDALDYLEGVDEDSYVAEKIDAAWVRRLVTGFERRIAKNSEQRARFESEPQKFMASEAELDADIKGLSIMSEHPEFYEDFVKADGAAHLVSLLAHENTDIAINAIEIISELLDDDVQAEREQWDVMVDAMLDSDLPSLLVQSFERFDETQESDRQGVYHSLAVLEDLASQESVADRIGDEAVLKYLLRRIKATETSIGQNTQYAAEVLQVLLQTSSKVRLKFVALAGVDTLLELLSAYRKRDPEKDSQEEEYVENLFDALTCVVEDTEGKHAFVEGEGVELALIMLKEGKFSRARALKVIDHASAGKGVNVCDKLVEAGGLKRIFAIFAKKPDREAVEHLLGIFSSLLRQLPGECAARIRTLAKFVEKDYEKVDALFKLRKDYHSRVNAVDTEIKTEADAANAEEMQDRQDEWYSRRLDAGLFGLQTVDVILAWLIAEDGGAKARIRRLLADQDEDIAVLRESLLAQVKEADGSEADAVKDMLSALVECLE